MQGSAAVGNTRTGFTAISGTGKTPLSVTLNGMTAVGNNGAGIQANGPVVGVTLNGGTAAGNFGAGVQADGGAVVMLDGITAASNLGAGVQANGANTAVLLGNSTITLNKGGGVSTTAGGRVFSYKNNKIKFNSPSEGFPLPQVNNAAAPMDPLAALQ